MPSKSQERSWIKKVFQQTEINYCFITERERPDFLITFQGQQIGIEVTDGTPETFRKG